jgi:hypothetical protein
VELGGADDRPRHRRLGHHTFLGRLDLEVAELLRHLAAQQTRTAYDRDFHALLTAHPVAM